MLVAFSFRAKPGKEKEFEQLLNNSEAGRAAAKAMGALRNTLFISNGRMIRVLEFPEGARPVPMSELAKQDANFMSFLRKLGPLIQDGFDPEHLETMEEFNSRNTFALAYDLHV